MTSIADWVGAFENAERPVGNLLDANQLLALAIAATCFYCGYASLIQNEGLSTATTCPPIDGTTNLTASEWAIIKPLFLLYVERESALQLEASRGMGIEAFGRASAEVANDIAAMEIAFPLMAFYSDIITV